MKCSNCGLVNGAEEAKCRRCGQAFTASPYVDAFVGGAQAGQAWTSEAPGAFAPYGASYTGPSFGPGSFERDSEHLKILAICHYVMGGLVALAGLFPLIYVAMGLALATGAFGPPDRGGAHGEAPPLFVGWIMVAFGAFFSLMIWAFALGTIYTGRFLKQRKKWIFCFVMACFNCMHFPIGTALGVFTLLVLCRESVKRLFNHRF